MLIDWRCVEKYKISMCNSDTKDVVDSVATEFLNGFGVPAGPEWICAAHRVLQEPACLSVLDWWMADEGFSVFSPCSPMPIWPMNTSELWPGATLGWA